MATNRRQTMAKVPPQKATNGNKPPLAKKGPPSVAPQNRTPVDAPNASQDEALAVTRNALTAPKKAPAKGVPKRNPYS